jgi:hypothetical protein
MDQDPPDQTSIDSGPSPDSISITLTFHGTLHTLNFRPTSTLVDLATTASLSLSVPLSSIKLLIPKLGLRKYPFDTTPLSDLPPNKRIQLLAATPSEIASIANPRPSRPPSSIKPAKPSKSHDWARAQAAATYTFHKLIPLPYLPHREKSLRFLTRLRDDAGIRAAMMTHKFSVPILTEMDPAEHTTHESRTLGLNRNRGEVIELRLRTDAYDGYRDYKTIRKTLCHELAHNIHGEHDRAFWDLTKQIEGEVERGDWRSGGRSVGDEEFYNPNDGGAGGIDGGGWSGGEFVLGGSGEIKGLTRRELMAKAAEERVKRQREAGGEGSSSAG